MRRQNADIEVIVGRNSILEALRARRNFHKILLAKGLKGNKIIFPKISVGATSNVMMASVLAKGITEILNAAREPEIVDLGNCLISMGAKIKGLGTSRILIQKLV